MFVPFISSSIITDALPTVPSKRMGFEFCPCEKKGERMRNKNKYFAFIAIFCFELMPQI